MSMTIGQYITSLRLKNNVSRKELANLLGVTELVMGRIENDKRPLKLNECIVLCKFFKVSTDTFLKLPEISSLDIDTVKTDENADEYIPMKVKKADKEFIQSVLKNIHKLNIKPENIEYIAMLNKALNNPDPAFRKDVISYLDFNIKYLNAKYRNLK